MVTYLYWTFVVLAVVGFFYLAGIKHKRWKASLVGSLVIFLTGTAAYYFYFEQIFVKRWGGVMSVSTPEGYHHLGSTWKYDHLWVETYDPVANRCYLLEHSRAGVLQGKVIFENCNPYPYKNPGVAEQ